MATPEKFSSGNGLDLRTFKALSNVKAFILQFQLLPQQTVLKLTWVLLGT